ncbi:MAG: agmatine deiminase family protein [Halieaceae bacterium]|nr:agmatine deiminase family protein [Halieaceae bacterium]
MSYRMPPEWAPHERTWMAWPCRAGMWANNDATAQGYTDVAHAIRGAEPVTMLVPPEELARARNFLGSDIDIFEVPIDDSWARDSGPNFVINDDGELAGVCFTFNAWGGKYDPYDQDALMGERILAHAGVPAIKSELIAEGGGLCVDGEGSLLTTDTCFPNANRNPDWSREQIEEELKRQLGVEKVLWLPGDPLDNETDGHVDGLAAFCAPGKVILETASDAEREPYFAELRAALESLTDARGRSLEIVELPEADWSVATNDRFCLSYVNFYIANGAVIAPSYGVATDDVARERLQDCFPGREIVMVPIAAVAEGGGGIHCITQQQPAV